MRPTRRRLPARPLSGGRLLSVAGAEDREEEERPVVRSRGGAGLNSGMFKGLCRLNSLSDQCSLGPHSSLLLGRRLLSPPAMADHDSRHAAVERWASLERYRLFPRREERRRAKEKDARPARVCFPSRGARCDSPGRVTGARFLTGVPSERRAFQRSDGGGRRLHLRPVRHRGYVNSIAVNSIAVNRLHLRPRRYRGVARQARARLADDRRAGGGPRPQQRVSLSERIRTAHPQARRWRAPPSSRTASSALSGAAQLRKTPVREPHARAKWDRCPHQPARGAHPEESDQAHALAGDRPLAEPPLSRESKWLTGRAVGAV